MHFPFAKCFQHHCVPESFNTNFLIQVTQAKGKTNTWVKHTQHANRKHWCEHCRLTARGSPALVARTVWACSGHGTGTHCKWEESSVKGKSSKYFPKPKPDTYMLSWESISTKVKSNCNCNGAFGWCWNKCCWYSTEISRRGLRSKNCYTYMHTYTHNELFITLHILQNMKRGLMKLTWPRLLS